MKEIFRDEDAVQYRAPNEGFRTEEERLADAERKIALAHAALSMYVPIRDQALDRIYAEHPEQRYPDPEKGDQWMGMYGYAAPALRYLARWAETKTDAYTAMVVTGTVWSSHYVPVARAYDRYVPMGLSAKEGTDGSELFIHLPKPTFDMRTVESLRRRIEGNPIGGTIQFHLEMTDAADDELLEATLQAVRSDERQFLGLYEDDIEAELATIFKPEELSAWLEEPNEQFQGHKPSELLHDPQRSWVHGFVHEQKI